MDTISDLMKDLDGAAPETVNRIAWEKGSLPVRLAMLGLASIRKGQRPLWWGYPPGVFISYKWEGGPMRDLVAGLANHVRQLGYRAFLDVENLDENADAYFQIPQFIVSLQDCIFYVLLLTRLSADLLTGRKGKTSWIHDEYQHAVRLTSRGRLIIVPVLLEPDGTTDVFTLGNVINLTDDQRGFGALNDILRPHPAALDDGQSDELSRTVEEFDTLFLNERWAESDNVLRRADHLRHTFDHQFRCMLHSIYTADQAGLDAALAQLYPVCGQQIVWHLYKGYCTEHGIPNRGIVE
jgi:hypothetical protein